MVSDSFSANIENPENRRWVFLCLNLHSSVHLQWDRLSLHVLQAASQRSTHLQNARRKSYRFGTVQSITDIDIAL